MAYIDKHVTSRALLRVKGQYLFKKRNRVCRIMRLSTDPISKNIYEIKPLRGREGTVEIKQ